MELNAASASKVKVPRTGPPRARTALAQGSCACFCHQELDLRPLSHLGHCSPPGDRAAWLDTAEAGWELSLVPSVGREERRGERGEDKWGGLQQRGWIEERVEEGMKGEEGEEEEGGGRGGGRRAINREKNLPTEKDLSHSEHLLVPPSSSRVHPHPQVLRKCPQCPFVLKHHHPYL